MKICSLILKTIEKMHLISVKQHKSKFLLQNNRKMMSKKSRYVTLDIQTSPFITMTKKYTNKETRKHNNNETTKHYKEKYKPRRFESGENPHQVRFPIWKGVIYKYSKFHG